MTGSLPACRGLLYAGGGVAFGNLVLGESSREVSVDWGSRAIP